MQNDTKRNTRHSLGTVGASGPTLSRWVARPGQPAGAAARVRGGRRHALRRAHWLHVARPTVVLHQQPRTQLQPAGGCDHPLFHGVCASLIISIKTLTQNQTVLAWRPPSTPAAQYAYTRILPPTGRLLWGRTPTQLIPCRARIGGELLVGQVFLSTRRADASGARCYVAHHLYGLRAEKRFDVLTIQVPDAGASACTAHCQAQLGEELVGSTDLYTEGRLLAADAGSCCALCRATYGCVAFVYHDDGSGRCALKASVTDTQQASVADLQQCASGQASVMGGVVREAALVDTDHCTPLHAVHVNRAYAVSGEDNVTESAASTLADCCHRCKEHALCRTFTWHKVLHTCSLQFAAGEVVASVQHVSGRLRK